MHIGENIVAADSNITIISSSNSHPGIYISKIRWDEIYFAPIQNVPRVIMPITHQQDIDRRRPLPCRVGISKKTTDSFRVIDACAELIVHILNINHSNPQTLSSMMHRQGLHGCHEITVGDHNVIGAVARIKPIRWSIRGNQ